MPFMRVLLSLAIASVLALAGCAEPTTQQTDDTPPSQQAENTAPTPVTIAERHELTLGMAATTWSFDVAEGAADAQVLIKLEGFSGTPVGHASDFCFKYTTPNGNGNNCPALGNINVAVSLGYRTLFDDDNLDAGRYSFTFSAPPSPAEFVIDANVQYE
jgi:hypothetical protein